MGLFDFECPAAEAMQKAVLLSGNAHGVSGANVANLKVPAPTPVEDKVEYYITQKGDTLSKIARQYYWGREQVPGDLRGEPRGDQERGPDLSGAEDPHPRQGLIG